MKCELKLMAKDAKEAIIALPTWDGATKFTEILLAEAIVVVPIAFLAGINALIATVVISITACVILMYFNASSRCKEAAQGKE